MIPGEVIAGDGDVELNAGRQTITVVVANTGDRPVQIGSHYHFAETNAALAFDRVAARGFRLNIAAGTAVRFEPGQKRTVELVALSGARLVYGFNAQVMGPLDKATAGAGSKAPVKVAATKPMTKKMRTKTPATKTTRKAAKKTGRAR